MRKTILIVDDEKDIQDVLSMCLEEEGYKLVFADDGEEAVEIFKKEEIDCILSDISMPKMSGIHLFHEVRKLGSSTPFIFCSAYPVLDAEDVMAEVFSIKKPFDCGEVVLIVKAAIDSMAAA